MSTWRDLYRACRLLKNRTRPGRAKGTGKNGQMISLGNRPRVVDRREQQADRLARPGREDLRVDRRRLVGLWGSLRV